MSEKNKNKMIDYEKIVASMCCFNSSLIDFLFVLCELDRFAPSTKKELAVFKRNLTFYSNKTLRSIRTLKEIVDIELDKVSCFLDDVNEFEGVNNE